MKALLKLPILAAFLLSPQLKAELQQMGDMLIDDPPSMKPKPKKKRVKRAPAKEPVVEVYVHDEYSSFSGMVANKEKMARAPAAFNVKARVIGIRRDIGLSDGEDDQAPRDIILNAGAANGISEGMQLKVKRHVPVLDAYRENLQKELRIEFAKVKVMHVQDDIAIARLTQMDPIAKGFAIGNRGILLGDYVGSN